MRLARLLTLSALALTVPASAGTPKASPPVAQPEGLEATTRAWHQKRLANLTSEDGWLSLVGLHWLQQPENRFGSAQDNDFLSPAGTPPRIGTFSLKDGKVTLAVEKGVSLTRAGQPFTGGELGASEGEADVLSLGSLRFYLIRRGERLGIRVKDSQAPARRDFHGIERYPVSAAWRVEARFEPAPSGRKLAVPTVLGTADEMDSPGTAIFQVGGKEYRLDPVREPGSERLFFIFADLTNRTETYGAGRFLYADLPKDGKVVLDFNQSYNPPCAFSPYATCPLPPRQNRLKLSVEAGEKRYGQH